MRRPEAAEYDPYYERYIALVDSRPITQVLAEDHHLLFRLLNDIPESMENYAYAPGKWTVKQVVGHIADTERNFAYRLLWAARGDPSPLPGYDDDAWAQAWNVTHLPLTALLREFEAIRWSSLLLVQHLCAEDWNRRVTANGSEATVRAVAYMMAGHERHHRAVIRDVYLSAQH